MANRSLRRCLFHQFLDIVKVDSNVAVFWVFLRRKGYIFRACIDNAVFTDRFMLTYWLAF